MMLDPNEYTPINIKSVKQHAPMSNKWGDIERDLSMINNKSKIVPYSMRTTLFNSLPHFIVEIIKKLKR